jgi:hypothetical protein
LTFDTHTPHRDPAPGDDGSDDDADAAIHLGGSSGAAAATAAAASDAAGMAAAAQAAKPRRLRAALWRRLSPQATLRIAFLSCHLLREAITPGDIIAWAADGQLPYFQLPTIAAEAAAAAAAAVAAGAGAGAADTVTPAASPLPAVCVTPQIWDSPARLVAHAHSLSVRLSVPLPPVNAEALLQRAALELSVPLPVADCAGALLRMHLLGRPVLQLPAVKPRWGHHLERSIEAAQPHVSVVALLVIAAKLVHGIGAGASSGGGGSGGEAGGQLPAGAPAPPASWQEWAARALVRLHRARGSVPSSQVEVRSI